MPLFLDAHQDIAWNMQQLGRDYRRPVAETRALEVNHPNIVETGNTLLGLPEYNQAGLAIVFGTLFALRSDPKNANEFHQGYHSIAEAYEQYSSQMDFYQRYASENPDVFRLILSKTELRDH
ncbi:MAG TPA: hypothetical protein PKK82_01865, partial [Anaerolineaceae bacterium]|nr:hypothetical protein [Anaerolineaceae bacterium]